MNRYLFHALMLFVACAAIAQEKAPETPAPSPSPGDQPTFPAQVELVTVDVVVTDKKGNPITDLTRDDVVVTEDGAPQTLTSFEAVQLPATASEKPPPRPRVSSNDSPANRTGRTFVVVFDDINMTPFQAHRAKAAVAEFLKTGVREGDRVSLVATGGGAWWSTRMEAGREELITLLKRLDGRHIPDMSPERMTPYEAMRIHIYRDTLVQDRVRRRFETYGVSPGAMGRNDRFASQDDPLVLSRASEVYFQTTARNRITLDVLERILNALTSSKGRKSLLLVSEGFIYDPNLDEFKRVVQASRRSNVAIYFIDTRGLGGLSVYATAQFGPALDAQDVGPTFSENMEAAEGSESIAADSGGFSVKNTNDLNRGFQRIANESQVYYLVGYMPSNTARDGKFRKIQVKVPGRKGLQVRARRGYYAPLEGGKTALDKKPGAGDPAMQAALDSPYEDDGIPLRMTSYVFEETILGKASVLVATDVDVRGFQFEEQDGRLLDTLEFLLIVAHRESGEFFRYDQKVEMKLLPETRERLARTWFPIVRDFQLVPGGYQAKIVVRDKATSRIGTVIHEFDVPDLSQLRISTPIISDTLVKPPDGSEERPRPQIVVRRAFPPEATVYCQVEVYGAAKDQTTGMPRVLMGTQIRRADGTVVNSISPNQINPTSLGKLSRLVGLPLGNIQPGEYEVVVSLRDEISGKTLEVREPFTVESRTASGP
jgi:VWFA-related protein